MKHTEKFLLRLIDKSVKLHSPHKQAGETGIVEQVTFGKQVLLLISLDDSNTYVYVDDLDQLEFMPFSTIQIPEGQPPIK